MHEEKIDTTDVNIYIKLVMRFVPYKKRKIAVELNKFCAECDKRLTRLFKGIAGNSDPPWTNVGYWLEGDPIEGERKIRIGRNGKYNLQIDWSKCDKNVIKKGFVPHSGFTWYSLPDYFEELFGQAFFDETGKSLALTSSKNGCSVSFSKLKCRDAIYWSHLPRQMTTDSDIDYNTVEGNYQSFSMIDIANELHRFAAHVKGLEMSIETKTCIGLWNLPFLRLEWSEICGKDAKYKVNKGYYLCETCGQAHQEMFGKIRKKR